MKKRNERGGRLFIELHLKDVDRAVSVNTDKIITVEDPDFGCIVNLQDTDYIVVRESYRKVCNMLSSLCFISTTQTDNNIRGISL